MKIKLNVVNEMDKSELKFSFGSCGCDNTSLRAKMMSQNVRLQNLEREFGDRKMC